MAELYNEGLLRKGLVRTSGLVRPDLLLTFDDIFSPYAIDRLEAALALDFDSNVYRTGNKDTTFAEAFMGNSPKLTYNPGSASSSQSTMTNSSGHLVWAPHNLAVNSATPATQTITVTSGADYTVEVTGTGSMALTGAGTGTATDGSPATITASTTSLTITLTGSLDTVAVYRSDLGGMAPVPGAVGDFQYYVPTNGAAVYLPRVGHHVYNGSTWVNEGLLIESEARTNLIQHSEDFASVWVKTASTATPTVTSTGPDGTTSATKLGDSGAGGTGAPYITYVVTVATSTAYTYSVFAKAGDLSDILLYVSNFTSPANNGYYFDLANGTYSAYGGTPPITPLMEDFGNGWYRCSITFTTDAADTSGSVQIYVADGTNLTLPLDNTSNVLIYGAQLEAAPTPSSYIPTNGSTVIRGGQSLTVPPAQFGWPEPEFIGPELVVDGSGNWVGDFDVAADLTEWGHQNASGTSTFSVTGGEATFTRSTFGDSFFQTDVAPPVAGVYLLTFDIKAISGGNLRYSFSPNSAANPANQKTASSVGSYATAFVSDGTLLDFVFDLNANGASVTIDNISVREINPLSVSIQMDGRMTYADEDNSQSAIFYKWATAGLNVIRADFATNGTFTGGVQFLQYTPSFNNSPEAVPGSYTPGINVPYNIASRHGSNFIRGAVDGVLAPLSTTPTALPDLSNTDLQIAQDFMGTIGTFRQFAGDIGDTGLVTATNPSTEPTLSLTFDGTGGSFYNLSWSE